MAQVAQRGRPFVPRAKVACENCGAEFERRLSDLRRLKTDRVFCSDACRKAKGSKPRRRTDRVCEGCGITFYPSHGRGQRFHDRACRDAWEGRNAVAHVCEVCGKAFTLSESQTKFRPNAVCSRDCDTQRRFTAGVGRIHNGKPAIRDSAGYIRVWQPDHPKAFRNGWVLEHRIVMEGVVGRYLETDEHVHHINGIKDDNRPENLAVLGHGEHSTLTGFEREQLRRSNEERLAEYERRFGPLP